MPLKLELGKLPFQLVHLKLPPVKFEHRFQKNPGGTTAVSIHLLSGSGDGLNN